MTTTIKLEKNEIKQEPQEHQEGNQQQPIHMGGQLTEKANAMELSATLSKTVMVPWQLSPNKVKRQIHLLLRKIFKGECEGEYLDERTIFIANIDRRMTKKLLYQMFVPLGPIELVRVRKYFEGHDSTFAFIVFKFQLSKPSSDLATTLLEAVSGQISNVDYEDDTTVSSTSQEIWNPAVKRSHSPDENDSKEFIKRYCASPDHHDG